MPMIGEIPKYPPPPPPPRDRIIREGCAPPVPKGYKQPDPKTHRTISFIKSGLRIAGYLLIMINLPAAVAVLTLSEIVGIVEELV